MSKITEFAIEEFPIKRLEKQGYQYIYAPSIAPDSDTPERQSFEDVLLMERLQTAVGRINPTIPPDVREEAIKQVLRLNSPELIANNEGRAQNRSATLYGGKVLPWGNIRVI